VIDERAIDVEQDNHARRTYHESVSSANQPEDSDLSPSVYASPERRIELTAPGHERGFARAASAARLAAGAPCGTSPRLAAGAVPKRCILSAAIFVLVTKPAAVGDRGR
jgi:hypothetical protein